MNNSCLNNGNDLYVVSVNENEGSAVIGDRCFDKIRNQVKTLECDHSEQDNKIDQSGDVDCFGNAGAVVFVISSLSIKNSRFMWFLEVAVRRTVRCVDFRTYFYFHDVPPDSIFELADDDSYPHSKVIRSAVDFIQIGGIQDVSQLETELVEYMTQAEDIRSAFKIDLFEQNLRRFMFQTAWIIRQLFIPVLIGIYVTVNWLSGPGLILNPVKSLLWEIIAVAYGFCFHLSLILVVFALTYRRCKTHFRKTTFWSPFLSLFMGVFILIAIGHMVLSLGWLALGWVFVGLLVGAVIDLLIREFSSAELKLLSLDSELLSRISPQDEISLEAVKLEMAERLQGRSQFKWACPVLSKQMRPAVFVSYARGDGWGARTVRSLTSYFSDNARNNELSCFVDQQSIPEGACWRFKVFSALHLCNIFVIFLDGRALNSAWTSVEFCSCLDLQSFQGYPMLMIFNDPSRDIQPMSSDFEEYYEQLMQYEIKGEKTINPPAFKDGTEDEIEEFKKMLLAGSFQKGIIEFMGSLVIMFFITVLTRIVKLAEGLSIAFVIYILCKGVPFEGASENVFITLIAFYFLFAAGYRARGLFSRVINWESENNDLTVRDVICASCIRVVILAVPIYWLYHYLNMPLRFIACMIPVFGAFANLLIWRIDNMHKLLRKIA